MKKIGFCLLILIAVLTACSPVVAVPTTNPVVQIQEAINTCPQKPPEFSVDEGTVVHYDIGLDQGIGKIQVWGSDPNIATDFGDGKMGSATFNCGPYTNQDGREFFLWGGKIWTKKK